MILIHVKFLGEWPALNKHSEKVSYFTSSDYFHLHWPVYSLLDFYDIDICGHFIDIFLVTFSSF